MNVCVYTYVRIEKYYHHDGEQLFLYQKVPHIKTQAEKKKNIFVIFVLQWIPIYLKKSVPKTKSNATFNKKEVDLD